MIFSREGTHMKRQVITTGTVLIAITLALGTAWSASAAWSQALPGYKDNTPNNSPVMFIENAGQWDEGARFQVWGGPGTMWLAEDAIWFTLLEQEDAETEVDPAVTLSPSHLVTQSPQRGVNIRLSFVGANPHPRIEPLGRLDTVVSYFLGDDPDQWRPDVSVWSGFRYANLYPGVDLELSSAGGQMAWRLAARPGADLSAVRLKLEGATVTNVEDSELRLATEAGPLVIPMPEATFPYQVEGDATSAEAASLLVEPTTRVFRRPLAPADSPADLIYSTFLGGSDHERGSDIAVDGMGSAYVTGFTHSSGFPTTPGAFDPNYDFGSDDAFVVKLNPTGSELVYATFLGGSERDLGNAIAVDGTGSIYVTGSTYSGDFPATPGAFDTSHNGGTCSNQLCFDAFVAKLNPAGSGLVYATYLGGTGHDHGFAIDHDNTGHVYISGNTNSSNFPTTSGAFDTSFNTSICYGEPCFDSFVVKLTTNGSALDYATFLGGRADETGQAIAADDADRAYVTGITRSDNFPTTPGAFDTSFNGGYADVFVVKLNTTGSELAYATFLGSDDYESSAAIAVDQAGSAHVIGVAHSSSFPTTPGAFGTSFNGGECTTQICSDVFVAKFNPSGSELAYATFLGGSSYDNGHAMTVDLTGHAYVTGVTFSNNFPNTPDAFDTSYNSDGDVFVTQINPTGSGLIYSTYLGGSGEDDGNAIAVDGAGSAYVVGFTEANNFPTTPSAFDTSFNGYTDVFVAKLGMGISRNRAAYLPLIVKN